MANYARRGLLGKGSMGEVYASEDSAGHTVAVKHVRKTLAMDPAMIDRLANEARLLGRVMHHNVVRVVDEAGDVDGDPCLVMNFVPGITLSKLLDRESPLRVGRAFAIAAQILTGLDAIHDAGVVHADIKSNNVLVGEQDRVTIIDFGLARALSRDALAETLLQGTPAFMAPELITGGAPSVASDLYAVGIIIYEMLTSTTPFSGAADVLDAHRHDAVIAPSVRVPESALSPAVDRVILRALEKDPAARFATAREFAAALDAALVGEWLTATVDLTATVELPSRAATTREEVRPTKEWAHKQPAIATRKPVETLQEKITATLDRAGRLIESHDLLRAITVLEAGLAPLACGPGTDELDAEAWRIESVLAALYDSVGNKSRAKQLALAAHEHALAVGCPIAAARTQAVLGRMGHGVARKPLRLARGSGQVRDR
ncbi:MAG: serine/threonine-protein kinase [Kofleriaceae bacterium]